MWFAILSGGNEMFEKARETDCEEFCLLLKSEDYGMKILADSEKFTFIYR